MEDTFCDWKDIDPDDHDGLDETVEELKLGGLIGDMDNDGRMTIAGTTAIRRRPAGSV